MGTPVILLLCLLPPNDPVEDPPFIWPIQLEPAITSSFGEWRSGHVHVGVDVKTWGKTGDPLLAVADGYVRRIRTSPWGYGKALYLALSDGRTVVYGHVDRFTPELDDLIWERQNREGRYTADIWLRRDEYPVRRGETVAFSGDTGATAPHLHFELRDENNIPINPLLNGLEVDDSTPPIPQFLLFRPVGSQSRIEADVRVRRFGVSWVREGEYRLQGIPEIDGSVGISVAAYDMMEGAWNRFSPYRFMLEVDGEKVFEVRYDRVSYEVSGLINLDRDYRYMVRRGARAHTLYRVRGNELPFYGGREVGAGYLKNLDSGIHQVQVTVADAFGNSAHVLGDILLNRPPRLRISDRMDDDRDGIGGWVEDPDGDDIELIVETMYLPGSDRYANDGVWEPLPDGSLVMDGRRFNLLPTIYDSLSAAGGWVVRVRAVDEWGRSTSTGPVSLGNLPWLDPGPINLAVEQYEGILVLSARFDTHLPGRLVFTVQQGKSSPSIIEGVELEVGRYRAFYPLQSVEGSRVEINARFEPVSGPVSEAVVLQQVVPLSISTGSVYESPDGIIRIDFPSGSVFEESFVQGGGAGKVEGVEEQDLVALSKVYMVGPEDILFQKNFNLLMVVDDLPGYIRPRQVGLYTHNGSEDNRRWFNLGGELEGNVLMASAGGLGPFAVLADTSRPELRLLNPRDGSRLRDDRPEIIFEIEDNASGFSQESQFVLRLNGTHVIACYDPPRDRLIYIPRDPLNPGDYWVNLDVVDNAGNVGRIRSTFTIVKRRD